MARIKINDLARNMELTEVDVNRIKGGVSLNFEKYKGFKAAPGDGSVKITDGTSAFADGSVRFIGDGSV